MHISSTVAWSAVLAVEIRRAAAFGNDMCGACGPHAADWRATPRRYSLTRASSSSRDATPTFS